LNLQISKLSIVEKPFEIQLKLSKIYFIKYKNQRLILILKTKLLNDKVLQRN